ncbi:hypothetical protein [Legionella oakridgensis]|uniref:hypothetical protein n=1 Tax=Legionella oakridgensis TaxID=29423 RepID=UPI0003DE6329|nr:hypothetical protein [Legionella oakridgensis]ETO92243.1 hypothetical protein LOR_13c01360 [Legionella oakridgensis RV-2-2007]
MNKIRSEEQQQVLLQQLLHMQKPVSFKPTAPKQRSVITAGLKRMPVVAEIGHHVAESGIEVTHFSELEGAFTHAEHAAKSLSNGFHLAALAFGIINFVRIPAIYLFSWMLGETIPVSLSKNVRWLYSSILVGLAVTALAAPVAAVPIALAGALLGLGASLLGLGAFYYRKMQLREELENITHEIAEKEQALAALQKEALDKERHLRQAFDAGEDETIKQLHMDVMLMQQEFDELKIKLQQLHDNQSVLEKKQLKRGTLGFVDRILGVGLASLAVIGVALSLFFPPVGAGILAISAMAGSVYVLGRITYPLIKKWLGTGEPLQSTSAKDDRIPAANTDESLSFEEKINRSEAMQDNVTEIERVHESTADLIQQLGFAAIEEKLKPEHLASHEDKKSSRADLKNRISSFSIKEEEEEDSREGESVHL